MLRCLSVLFYDICVDVVVVGGVGAGAGAGPGAGAGAGAVFVVVVLRWCGCFLSWCVALLLCC
jgi:hypothetical protein